MRKPSEFENHPASYERARDRGSFQAFCKHVTDGDTFDFLVSLGIYQYSYSTIRLHALDTAEIFHPRNAAELADGLAAKKRVQELILDKPVLIRTYKDTVTFDRFVADVYYDDDGVWTNLADTLRTEGFEKKESYA